MKIRNNFIRVKGTTLIKVNTVTIEDLKLGKYKENEQAKRILDELAQSLENENKNKIENKETFTSYMFSADQSLRLFFYSNQKLENVEQISIINYVETKLSSSLMEFDQMFNKKTI